MPNYDPTGELIESETHYRFAPRDGDPRHCCEVEDPTHVKMLLAVTESYRKVAMLSDAEKSRLAGRPKTVPLSQPRPRPASVPKPKLQVVEAEPEAPIEDLAPQALKPESALDETWLAQATVTEIQAHCKDLTNNELADLEDWEMENKSRQGVFNAIRMEFKSREEVAKADVATPATA